MKRFTTLIVLTMVLASLGVGLAYEPTNWQLKAVKLAKAETKIKGALWSQSLSFWVTVDDDGSNRTGYAQYLCFILNDAGKPKGELVIVTIWDRVSSTTNNPKQLGKAPCQ